MPKYKETLPRQELSLMMKMLYLLSAFALACPTTASAGVVYNNDFGGSNSGDQMNTWEWPIGNYFGCIPSGGCTVANSFTLSASTSITQVRFAVWLGYSDSFLSSVDWAFRDNTGADPLSGAILASGTAAPSQTLIFQNTGGWYIQSESFNLPVPLPLSAGTTYWFQLGNAVDSHGYGAWWDESDGPSLAYMNPGGYLPNGFPCSGPCTGSESFQLLDTVAGGVPEPGTLVMLTGGIVALLAVRRRRK